MAFDPHVTTFAQVTNKLTKINTYLTDLSKFLQKIDWSQVPFNEDGGGEEAGGNPPKWPPR
jgi:hypothetical protein